MKAATEEIAAIDVHGHYGQYLNTKNPLVQRFRSGGLEVIAERARQSSTELTFVSPLSALTPRLENDAVKGNEEAAQEVPHYSTLRFWVVIDPRKPETFEQAKRLLPQPQCVGIKIHPEEHGCAIGEFGEKLFRFAAGQGAIVLTHSGEQNSLPKDFIPFADEFQEVRLILAHLGCGWDGDPRHQVRAIQAAKQGNVYVDTSSAQSLTPGLIEWAVDEIGAGKILYGTDTPLYNVAMQRARIDHAEIAEADKRLILRENAIQLFSLSLPH